jgi:transmembrane sensor
MNDSKLNYLFQVYFSNTATDQQKEELAQILSASGNEDQLNALLEKAWKELPEGTPFFSKEQSSRMLTGILQISDSSKPFIRVKMRFAVLRYMAAASILLFLSIIGYKFLPPTFFETPFAVREKNAPLNENILPGTDRAVLTLANGSTIELDSAKSGSLAQLGNSQIVKLNSSSPEYNKTRDGHLVYNTLSTPAGGQYRVVLADGTRIWLNASSSLHFPISFSGKERLVKLTGEAYFEVANNADMPFKVKVGEAEVQVLGTHFNIMAYENEKSINTTLLEGSVRVFSGAQQAIITPGQQTEITKTGGMIVSQADVEEAVAWKNGFFEFNSFDIQQVMRQIARWYNVEIIYMGSIPEGHFSGYLKRSNDIMQVLEILKLGNVQVKIVGRKIMVL